jgi:hypothetical protein
MLVGHHDFIKSVGDFPRQPGPIPWKAHGEIAVTHSAKARKKDAQICMREIGGLCSVPDIAP